MTTTKVRSYLEEKVAWNPGADPSFSYEADFNGERMVIRLNDFPDESLYTLLVDNEAVAHFDDWPEQWNRP